MHLHKDVKLIKLASSFCKLLPSQPVTIETLEQSVKYVQSYCSGVFIVNFEHISQLVLVFLLLTLSR